MCACMYIKIFIFSKYIMILNLLYFALNGKSRYINHVIWLCCVTLS